MLTSTIISDAHAVCQITACGSKSKGPATVSGAAKPRRPGSTGREAPAWRAGQYSNILKNVGMSGKGGGSGGGGGSPARGMVFNGGF